MEIDALPFDPDKLACRTNIWLALVVIPLIVLAQHSDTVLLTILAMAERLADKRHRCAGCPERLLVLQNLGQKLNLSEDY